MKPLHISCAADGAYVPHSAAMVHSVLTHGGPGPVHIHYLHGPALPRRSRDRLASMVAALGGTIAFVAVTDERVAKLPEPRHFTRAMWYRMLLPDLLPAVDRVLYLDVDTIVADTLQPLWETDLSGQLLAAVTNVFEPWSIHRPRALGLSGPDAYFNSGVLLLNLDEMRGAGATRALLSFLGRSDQDLLWPDQDALNVVLGARRVPLHPRWNCMNSLFELPWSADVFGTDVLAEARQRPGIRHFEGPGINKPWHVLCEREMRSLYFEHRRATPWPRVRREGVTVRNMAVRARLEAHRRLRRTGRTVSP